MGLYDPGYELDRLKEIRELLHGEPLYSYTLLTIGSVCNHLALDLSVSSLYLLPKYRIELCVLHDAIFFRA